MANPRGAVVVATKRVRHRLDGYALSMSGWGLLLVPAALGSVVVLLALTTWLEQWVLSPRALILSAARARRASPRHVEALLAEHCEVILARSDRSQRARSVTRDLRR